MSVWTIFHGQDHFTHFALYGSTSGAEVGAATSMWSRGRCITIARFDLDYYSRNLGMHMMTSAVGLFAESGFRFLFRVVLLENALYKTQFSGAETITGFIGQPTWTNSNTSSGRRTGTQHLPRRKNSADVLRRQPGADPAGKRVSNTIT
jgi:hypothetical protein